MENNELILYRLETQFPLSPRLFAVTMLLWLVYHVSYHAGLSIALFVIHYGGLYTQSLIYVDKHMNILWGGDLKVSTTGYLCIRDQFYLYHNISGLMEDS